MAEQEKKETKKSVKVYSKNYFVKGFGPIGGKEVTKEIDAALNSALSDVDSKASDFHKVKEEE